MDNAPSPGTNATNDCGIGAGLSPRGARRIGPAGNFASPPRGRGRYRVVPVPGEGASSTTSLRFRAFLLAGTLLLLLCPTAFAASNDVARGLAWLAAQQRPDGSWSTNAALCPAALSSC